MNIDGYYIELDGSRNLLTAVEGHHLVFNTGDNDISNVDIVINNSDIGMIDASGNSISSSLSLKLTFNSNKLNKVEITDIGSGHNVGDILTISKSKINNMTRDIKITLRETDFKTKSLIGIEAQVIQIILQLIPIQNWSLKH